MIGGVDYTQVLTYTYSNDVRSGDAEGNELVEAVVAYLGGYGVGVGVSGVR